MKERIEAYVSVNMAMFLTGCLLTSLSPLAFSHADGKNAKHDSNAAGQMVPTELLQDLVHAEAALTLTQMQQKEAHSFSPGRGSSVHDLRHEVRSIYGVGKNLYAELVLSSKHYIFLSGQSQPMQGPDHRWQLQRIQPPCIHLKHDGKPTVLCLGASFE